VLERLRQRFADICDGSEHLHPFNCGTADEVAVAAEVLGGTMNDYVCPVLYRVLKIRAHEGVVHDKKGMSLLANLTDLSNIHNSHQGIGRCLNPDKSGVFPDRLLDIVWVFRVHVCEL